eukprot:gene31778-38411_t
MGNSAVVIAEAFNSVEDQVAGDSIPEKLSRGYNLFLKNDSARDAFVSYLRSGVWTSKLTSTMAAMRQDHVDCKSADVANEAQNNDISGYSLPLGAKATDFPLLSSLIDSEDKTVPDSVISSCFANSDLKAVMIASVFPLFLESHEYQQWLDQQGEREGAALNLLPATMSGTRDSRLDDLFQHTSSSVNAIIQTAVQSVDPHEVYLMLSSGNWLRNLLTTVEELPLCVSIATARRERPGFPLVYVNQAFESMTGYSRKDIINRNCRFLQSEHTEKEQIDKLSYALRHALPTKVVITNQRKDGTQFLNLLAIKPIFNMQGEYSYVIGVQYDVANRESVWKEIQQVDDLLSILPNVLK